MIAADHGIIDTQIYLCRSVRSAPLDRLDFYVQVWRHRDAVISGHGLPVAMLIRQRFRCDDDRTILLVSLHHAVVAMVQLESIAARKIHALGLVSGVGYILRRQQSFTIGNTKIHPGRS